MKKKKYVIVSQFFQKKIIYSTGKAIAVEMSKKN